jgi:post-segregation antitoxin (ccd killing protein)
MSKRKLTLSIDEELIKEAKQKEINICNFLEVILVDYFTRCDECSRREYTLIA